MTTTEGRVAREVHSRPSRWMHWINFPLLVIMMWSGLRIYNADDVSALSLFGLRFDFFPQGVYDFFVADRRLAKGIAFHLVFGWLFVINGVLYGIWLAWSGEWRDLVPDRRSLRDAPATVAHDLHLRKGAPVQGRYNPAQQITYTIVILMGALMILTGFAIYKPANLGFLTWIMGGYETARLLHFGTTLGFVVFFVVHILQVGRAGWRNFASMVTGYRLEDAPTVDREEAP